MRTLLLPALILGLLPMQLLAEKADSEQAEAANDSAAPPIELFLDEPARDFDLSAWRDPVINRMVNFELLGSALADGDAAGVTDVAMQLAHAERVLLRNHPKITSADLYRTAMTMAQNSGDTTTLARIQKAAASSNNKELASQVKVAMSLGGASRAVIPPPEIKLDTDPQQLAVAQALANQIEVAEQTRDLATLHELRLDVAVAELPQSATAWLDKLIDRAEKSVGEGAGENAEALTLLAGASRGWYQDLTGQPTPSPIRKIAPNGLSIRVRESETTPSIVYTPPNQPQRRPATSQRMQNLGYRRYNNVAVDGKGNVFINGQKKGRADPQYNRRTGQTYYNYPTKNGGRIVRQSNGNVWVRPGQPAQPRLQLRQQRWPQGGKSLGRVPQFWNR